MRIDPEGWTPWAWAALGAGLLTLCGALVGLGYLIASGAADAPVAENTAVSAQVDGPQAQPLILPIVNVAPAPALTVMVEVQGAVAAPGTYAFPQDGRVRHAIDKAGGVLAEGEISDINIAAALVDGSVLTIPYAQSRGVITPVAADLNPPEYTRSGWAEAGAPERGPTPSASSKPGKVNLNTATQAELETLPGVGEKTAEKIIQFRDTQPFASVEDLQYIQGIGEKRLESLRPHVTVN